MSDDQIGDVTHTLIRDEPPTIEEIDDARMAAFLVVDTHHFPWWRLEIIVAHHPLGTAGPLFPVQTGNPCWTIAWSAWAREMPT